jgi:hypothetical protein
MAVKRFHSQLRAEFLDRELSLGREEVLLSLEKWGEKTNFKMQHGNLGNPPSSVAAKRKLALRPTASAPVHAGQ